MNYSCHFTSSLVKNGSKTIKGGTWLYNTILNIFTTCGKSFMHRLPCGFEGSCHQSRQSFIKGKERYSLACSADGTGDTPPPALNPSQQQRCFLQSQGEGRKTPLMKIPWSTQPPTSLLPACSTELAKITQALLSCIPLVLAVAHLSSVHTGFCHLLNKRWINLHSCSCSHLWDGRGLWKGSE